MWINFQKGTSWTKTALNVLVILTTATLFERTSAIRADPTAAVPPADVHLQAFGL